MNTIIFILEVIKNLVIIVAYLPKALKTIKEKIQEEMIPLPPRGEQCYCIIFKKNMQIWKIIFYCICAICDILAIVGLVSYIVKKKRGAKEDVKKN